MAQQIRAAQQKAALSGQAPLAWAIGARCQAVWSGDGGWYNGTVSGVSVNDRFIVTFDEDGGVEEVRGASHTCTHGCHGQPPDAAVRRWAGRLAHETSSTPIGWNSHPSPTDA